MFSFQNPLYFPKLVYLRDVSFKSWQEKGKTALFKLDWSEKERRFKQNFEKMIETKKDKVNVDYSDFLDLPAVLDEWLKSFHFAIPSNYLTHIKTSTRSAVFERNLQYSFDTMIREICLIPAEAHIYVAFSLIDDCKYDLKTNYFYRREDSFLLKHTLLYKFWSGQTGRGLLWEKAKLDKLEQFKDYAKDKCVVDYELRCNLIDGFLKVFKNYEDKREKIYFDVLYEKFPVTEVEDITDKKPKNMNKKIEKNSMKNTWTKLTNDLIKLNKNLKK